MPDDKRRPATAEPDDDPFNSPVTHCHQCGNPIMVIRRDREGKPYGGIEGLVLGACKHCNLKAALVERINPIWRRGDDPDILRTLEQDMMDSERQARAYFGDDNDLAWTRA